ncbi:superoxide dismutase [Candidatus Woesebacteria bacterium]|nr:superoxide dismutase [Candidatus Woesebacteria bacterium]
MLKHKRIELPDLPYKYDALAPVISKEIMMLHHTRHHLAYVTGANAAMDKLEKARAGEGMEIDFKATMRDLSFHLNGHKLHSIFWSNMRKNKKDNAPSGSLLEKINEQFGSFEAFQTEFAGAAKAVEGSGWAALIVSDGDLHVIQIQNQNLMMIADSTVLLVLDVWEHAYYLDYQNDRGKYVDSFWGLVNWDDVAARLK